MFNLTGSSVRLRSANTTKGAPDGRKRHKTVVWIVVGGAVAFGSVSAGRQNKTAGAKPGINTSVNTDESEVSMIRDDYPNVAVVAYVRCDSEEIVERIGGATGYVVYRVSGKVVESFKGTPRKGQNCPTTPWWKPVTYPLDITETKSSF